MIEIGMQTHLVCSYIGTSKLLKGTSGTFLRRKRLREKRARDEESFEKKIREEENQERKNQGEKGLRKI